MDKKKKPLRKIKVNLPVLMARSKFRHVSELVEASGVSRTTVTALYYQTTKRVDFATLEKLCRALDCAPGDLLVLEDD